MVKYQKELIELISENGDIMHILKCIRSLGGEYWLGGGAIRNLVWDKAHGITTVPKDYDVVHYNLDNSLDYDMIQWHKLMSLDSSVEWQVVNQLRKVNCTSLLKGVMTWIDISSCVIIQLNDSNEILVEAPYGLDILFNLILMPNTSNQKYKELILKKQWQTFFPKLKLIEIN